MTPAQIELAARNRYNAVNDTNWSSAEIMGILYNGCLEISRDCGLVIEKRFITTSGIGTSEYEFPTNATSIRRITYNGRKLEEITMRQDDSLTIENQLSADQGSPNYYYVWNRVIKIRPVPDDVVTIEIFAICNEQVLTSSSVMDTPDRFHGSLVYYIAKEMAAKDLNWEMFDRYDAKWEAEKTKIRSAIRREKRGDAFLIVGNEQSMPFTTLGNK